LLLRLWLLLSCGQLPLLPLLLLWDASQGCCGDRTVEVAVPLLWLCRGCWLWLYCGRDLRRHLLLPKLSARASYIRGLFKSFALKMSNCHRRIK
jgi:hypothetical protein